MFPKASILLLEADEKHEERLQEFCKDKKGQMEYQIALLSATDQETVPWFGGGDTGNSMFRERSETYVGDVAVPKVTQTLDQVVAASHIKDMSVDLIKVDVQGAELLVLRGGVKSLRQATFVQIEASTVAYNDGGSCTWQVDEFLRQQGYALYDMGDKRYYMPLFQTPGLGQYDLLYVNTNKLPDKVKNATFCAGAASSSALLEDSMVELENLVGIPSSSSGGATSSGKCHRGSGGVVLIFGLVVGYLMCLLQNRFFRFRRIHRND
jgi:FkbM family methyltransferase